MHQAFFNTLSLFSEEVILAEDDIGPGDSMNVPVLCMLNKVTEFKNAVIIHTP